MATAKLYNGQNACACPVGDLPATSLQDCGVSFGQIVRFAVQKAVGANPFDGAVTFITSQADWTTALSAVGDDKLVLSPIFAGTTLTDGAMNVSGENDNSTPFGAGVKTNHNNTVLAGEFLELTVDNMQSLLEILNCNDSLKFYLVNDAGQVFHVAVVAPATATTAIPATLTTMDGPITDGLNTQTRNLFSIKFKVQDISFVEASDASSFIFNIDNP
jgi:hypothetical protein